MQILSLKDWTPRERYTIEPLKINWAYSTNDLKNAFGEWAKAHRPPDFPEDQTHGRTSERDWLKKLAAKRLLDAFGSWEQAAAHSKSVLTDPTTGRNYALYSSKCHGNAPLKRQLRLSQGNTRKATQCV
ncbi:MAG: hypothetical protein QOD99_798 [Chthoniobacter sp.]|jgi:hypothetical protein|nr:hypothetical protein [Chthoniobacter sp.]